MRSIKHNKTKNLSKISLGREKSGQSFTSRRSILKKLKHNDAKYYTSEIINSPPKLTSPSKTTDLKVLDNCEDILNKKLHSLRDKWEAIQLLETNLTNPPKTLKNENLIDLENDFYLKKITELQEIIIHQDRLIDELKK